MERNVRNFLYICSEIWRNIGIAQRASIILIGIVAVAAIAGVTYMGTRPNWQVLYSGLDAETSSKIYELVQDEGVQVRLKNSGRTILVPFKHVYALRLKIASEGVVVGQKAVGLELFDNVKFGLTEKQQAVGFQRALQGELQRMIVEMPEVAQAKVLINMPQKRVLRRAEATRPTASVMVVLQRGRNLDNRQVASIRYLVSSAVEQMTPQDVTVADSSGRLLAKQRTDDEIAGGDPGTQLEIQRRMEADLKEKAEAILRPIVGMEAVLAMVSVDLDLSQVERVVEKIDSAGVVAISQKQITEETAKETANKGGVPGSASNTSTVAVANPEAGGGDANDVQTQNRKTVESEYLAPKTTERTSLRGPRVKHISVAVSIAEGAEGPRAPELIEKYRNLVRSAVGAVVNGPDGRTDSVVVEEIGFAAQMAQASAPLVPAVPVTQRLLEQLEGMLPGELLRPIIAFIMLITLFGFFRKQLRENSVESTALGAGESGQVLEVSAGGTAAGQLAAGEEEQAGPFALISQQAEDDPAALASALEAWLQG